jgi:hypothetical protein
MRKRDIKFSLAKVFLHYFTIGGRYRQQHVPW